MKALKHILFICFILGATTLQAQVSFEALVSKKKLGVNERLRVDFKMNQDGDNFSPPSFANFNIVAGPNQSVSHSWVNGKRSFSKTYSYFLAPKKQGRFTIKQASIEVEGETYKTTPINITITKAVKKPKDSNSADYIADNNIHLVAQISKTKPYLNEAVTVEYRLYVAPNTGVSNWRETDSPKYNGFWSQSTDSKTQNVQRGEYNGEEYRYVVLRRTILYPQKTGELKIEPLSLDITIDIPTNRRDFFGNRLMQQVHKTISAKTRVLDVKPLPEENKPDSFTGAVGNFNFKTTLSKTELNATESLTLALEVAGKGNLKLFNLPKITLPSTLEVYEPEHSERISTNYNGMQGRISDNYTIVPQYKGKYPVPTINFSYFDPSTETYKTVTSKDLTINVINGPNVEEKTTALNNNSKETGNNYTFADIKTETDFINKNAIKFFKSTNFWIVLVVSLLAIPIALFIRRKKEDYALDVVGSKTRKANRLSKKYLSSAKKSLGKKEPFYIALEKALHNYLKAKLRIETSEMSKDKISDLLDKRKVESETISNFISILENCEQARYSPFTDVTMQQDFSKAEKSITAIDKEIT
ncbi:BatD family protein [Aurantibacter sp.]|uniref:BatD family protein n=1 Tax=Aurantibacter sp. TaxID=2807103 RepID=UPI0035C851AC